MKIPFFSIQREHKKILNNLIKSFKVSLKHGKTLQGPEVQKLEKQILKYVDKKYAIAVGSCTDALFFSLKALEIKKGDEVIVTSYSYLASATCVLRTGAKPVFVDVDKNGNMLIDEIEKKITKRTKAIIYVHLYGYFQNPSKLLNVVKKYRLFLIEDFAQSLGAKYKSNYAGSLGHISCTSFDPTKVLSAPGSGGMVFTNNKDLKIKITKMRYHGKNSNGDYDLLGINSQLSTINASSLLVKLKYFKKYEKKRIQIANKFINRFKKLQIELPPKFSSGQHIYHKFVIQTQYRDKLRNFLNKSGIQTLIHYQHPIPKLSLFYKKSINCKTPNANYLSKNSLSLPIHPYLKNSEVNFIIKTVEKFFKKNKFI